MNSRFPGSLRPVTMTSRCTRARRMARSAIAFLHGYLLGKSGESGFNLESLTKQTDAFINHCLDNPNDTAVDAMMKAKG